MIVQCPNAACRKYNLVEEAGVAACLLCRAPLPASEPPPPPGPLPDDEALFPPEVADDHLLGLE